MLRHPLLCGHDDEETTKDQIEGILMQSTIPLQSFGEEKNNIKGLCNISDNDNFSDYELALDWCRKFDLDRNGTADCNDYLSNHSNRAKLLLNLMNIKKENVGLQELFLTSCFYHAGNSLLNIGQDNILFTRIVQDWMNLQLSFFQSREKKEVSEKTAFDFLMQDEEEDEREVEDEEIQEEEIINEEKTELAIVNILNLITDVSISFISEIIY